MSHAARSGRRVALVVAALFLGSLFTACDSITAPGTSISSQADQGLESQIESIDQQTEEVDFLRPVIKQAE
ncbi:MAG: hypothetical protein PVF05_08890 [Gemmatimonadales bacterium]|jgi:hypothetical protein